MTQLRPRDLTERLEISASSLRNWSDRFAPVLSPTAQKVTTEAGTPAQRRYTQGDLRTLQRAKQLLGQSKTYEEALHILQEEPLDELVDETTVEPRAVPSDGSVALTGEHRVTVAFREALAAKDETIRTLEQALQRKGGDVHLLQMANQSLVVSKEETISVLKAQIDELMNREDASPAASPAATRFRFGFLNWLLADMSSRDGT